MVTVKLASNKEVSSNVRFGNGAAPSKIRKAEANDAEGKVRVA